LRPDGTLYNGPVIPALTSVQQTQDDYLFRVVKGGYYGHPDSLRGEFVMNGGNPTSGIDNAEVPSYPVGTLPDANWRGSVFNFLNNASPDGAIEYKSNTFNGALKGKLLVARYSQHDDIITLTPGADNNIASFIEGNSIPGFSGFVDPLDLTEDTRNGNIYVSEYGGDSGKITLLRPDTTGLTDARSLNTATVFKSNPNTIPGCDEVMADQNTNQEVTSRPVEIYTFEKLKVHPNPVQNRFNVEFPATYKGNYTIQLVDVLGVKYDLAKVNLNGGGSNTEIDISKLVLKTGIYFLKVTSEDKRSDVIKLFVL
jgi:hypothetical protein